jgi:hypothetical protein
MEKTGPKNPTTSFTPEEVLPLRDLRSVCESPPKKTPPRRRKLPTPAEIILTLLRKDSKGEYCNVFETLTSEIVLKLAYETIKSKPGNMVKGTTKVTLDGISNK